MVTAVSMMCDPVCAVRRKPVTLRRGVSTLARPVSSVLGVKRGVEITLQNERRDRVLSVQGMKLPPRRGEEMARRSAL